MGRGGNPNTHAAETGPLSVWSAPSAITRAMSTTRFVGSGTTIIAAEATGPRLLRHGN